MDTIRLFLAAVESWLVIQPVGEVLFYSSGLMGLGMAVIRGGYNMLKRGRGGQVSQEGSLAVLIGVIMAVSGMAAPQCRMLGIPLGHALLSSAVLIGGGGIGGPAAVKRIRMDRSKKRAMADQFRQAQEQREFKSWHEFVASTSPADFERFCGWMFQEQGYEVQPTGGTGDQGIDLTMSKGAMVHVAQCKRYTNNPVGASALRDFYGALVDQGADHGYYITTSSYTRPASMWARGKPITLMDRDDLKPWVVAWGRRDRSQICRFCGSRNREGARFCSACGAQLVP